MGSTAVLAAEGVCPDFTVDGMLLAREKTRQAIRDIAGRIRPGMMEEDAVAMAKGVLIDSGLQLSWHPTRVRFGANTIKPMKQAPGHRVSDFPHAAIHAGSLADFDQSPAALRWILEIHLRDPQRRFGAFFEDMLLDDAYYK
jgi:hypothetical protein